MVNVTKGGNPIDDSNPADTGEGLSLQQRVAMVIDRIRPSVQNDGGDIELLNITEDMVVRIRMHGACVGCPSSNMTLRLGIEQNLKTYVPEITGVEAIEDD